MPRKEDVLNETQISLVQEALDSFLEGMLFFYKTNKLMNFEGILKNLQNIARTENKSYLQSGIKTIKAMYVSQDPYLIFFINEYSRILQLSLGRSGDLKLEKVGGYLTPEQKTHLRLLTADLLQKGIDKIKALEQAKTAEAKPSEAEKRAGSDSDDVATSAKRPRA